MSKLSPVDLSFLLLETPSRQMHMTAYQVFRLPAREKKTFIPRLLAAYRSGPVAKPFNQKLKWLDKGVASWETVEPDLRYHVRHIAVPAPGSMQSLSEIVSFLNSPLLDRSLPLWECYIIEGLEDDQFAVMVKVHHAMIDGMGAMKLFDQCIGLSPADKAMNSIWMPLDKPAKARPRAGRPQAQSLLSRLGKLPADLLQIGAGMAELGAQNLRLKPAASSLPFAATKTLFNNTATSSERRYGSCEIPLAQRQGAGQDHRHHRQRYSDDGYRPRPARLSGSTTRTHQKAAGGTDGHVGSRRKARSASGNQAACGAGAHGQTRCQRV